MAGFAPSCVFNAARVCAAALWMGLIACASGAGPGEAPLSPAQVEAMETYALRLAEAELYARRGAVFDDIDLQSVFDAEPWYRPQPGEPLRLTEGEVRASAILRFEFEHRTLSGPRLSDAYPVIGAAWCGRLREGGQVCGDAMARLEDEEGRSLAPQSGRPAGPGWFQVDRLDGARILAERSDRASGRSGVRLTFQLDGPPHDSAWPSRPLLAAPRVQYPGEALVVSGSGFVVRRRLRGEVRLDADGHVVGGSLRGVDAYRRGDRLVFEPIDVEWALEARRPRDTD